MNLAARIYSLFNTLPTVSAALGGRLYPENAAQDGATPYATYGIHLTQRHVTTGGNKQSLKEDFMDIEIHSPRFNEIVDVFEAMEAEVHGYRGEDFQGIFIEDVDDIYNDKTKTFTRTVELRCFYN